MGTTKSGDKTKAQIIADTAIDMIQWNKNLNNHALKAIKTAAEFVPTTAGDWSSSPVTVDAALDELGARTDDLITDAANADKVLVFATTTGIPGAAKIANKNIDDSAAIATSKLADAAQIDFLVLGGAITTGGAWTQTGAHTLGITTTGNTAVTLPTSGTLARISGESHDDVVSLKLRDVTTVAQTVEIRHNGDAGVGSTLTGDHILTLDLWNTDRVMDIKGDVTFGGAFSTGGSFSAASTVSLAAALTTTGAALTLATGGATVLDLPASSAGKVAGFAKASIGFAALNAATTGVAVPTGSVVPSGATAIRVWAKVTEAFTDVGTAGDANTSTIKVGLEDQDNDLQTAAALTGAPFNAPGNVALSELDYATPAPTEFITVSADRQVAITWTAGTGDATALATGAMDIYVEYVY